MQAIDIAASSCGGFSVIPMHALDRFYHVVTWLEPSVQAEMGVLAVEDNTVVTVTLPRSNNVEVGPTPSSYSLPPPFFGLRFYSLYLSSFFC